jgi:hypothetical protein
MNKELIGVLNFPLSSIAIQSQQGDFALIEKSQGIGRMTNG